MTVYADPAMLEVTNLDHASPATILFQRGSVITFDIVLGLGAEDVLAALSAGLRPQGGVQAAAVLGRYSREDFHQHSSVPRAGTMSVVMTEPRWKRIVAGEAWSSLVTSSMAASAYTTTLPSNQQPVCNIIVMSLFRT